jgi:3-deoxy-7-phosphoheptulonate synthase
VSFEGSYKEGVWSKNNLLMDNEIRFGGGIGGGGGNEIIGENHRVLAVTGDTTGVEVEFISSIEGVKAVDRVDRPYKLASRGKKNRTEIAITKDCSIGAPDQVAIMAGPCSIDSEGALDEAAAMAANRGVKILRGGAYKPRTGPYSFQGHGEPALKATRSRPPTGKHKGTG